MKRCVVKSTFIPELGVPYRGKVRDVYDQENQLVMIANDRVCSFFDNVFVESVPDKGRMITGLTKYWFDKTQDIVPNHVLSNPDPNILIVKKCFPFKVEIVVCSHLIGSLWREYQKGKRNIGGIVLSDNLQENELLPQQVIIPIAKDFLRGDHEVTKEEVIEKGIVTADQWSKIETISFELFKRGKEYFSSIGMQMMATKYEFGLNKEGSIVLIDEIHTPETTRLCKVEEKENCWNFSNYVADHNHEKTAISKAVAISSDLGEQIRQDYSKLYQKITGDEVFEHRETNISQRIIERLRDVCLIKGYFALVLIESEREQSWADKITHILTEKEIPSRIINASFYKQPSKIMDIISLYNESSEPVVCIVVSATNGGVAGILGANSKWPVIACPHFKDWSDYYINIHSSLQMPSGAPLFTIIDPQNAALGAVKILKTMNKEIPV